MTEAHASGRKFLTPRRLLIAVVLLALAGVGYQSGYLHWPGGAREGQTAGDARKRDGRRGAEGPVAVTVAPVRITDVPVTIDAVGTVQALNTVTIRTQVDGRLVKLAFKEGQDVQKDDVLALIDPTVYQAQYDQAVAKKSQDEANYANAKVDLSRYQKLAANNYGSQQQSATQKAQVAQLEAQIRADQGAIDNAKALLDYTTIRSPIAGRTGIRLVDEGNILHASDQTGIVVVTQLKPIFVVFTAPQQTLPVIQKAQAAAPAKSVALAPDNVTALDTGVVSVIDNQIDQTTGTVKIKAVFDNQSLKLWPGQFVNVRLTVDVIRQATVVPSAAVQRGPNGAFVYVVNDDETISFKTVSLGRQDEFQAVVTSGLDVGAKVVTSGFTRLSDGASVHVAEQQQDGAPKGESSAEKASPSQSDDNLPPRKRDRRGREKRSEQGGPAQMR
jgi:multidrug efflux system membrane fusion protein